jgi:hypothetical protein
MKSFKIPVVPATTSIDNAFKVAIDASSSGVLVKTGGNLRLVHYRDLVNAASKNEKRIAGANYVSVLKLGPGKVSEKQKEKVEAAGLKFGYFSESDGTAHMFSASEQLADLYSEDSDGTRCTRPGKPANTPGRRWYHYYPPIERVPKTLKECRICGAALL